LRKLRGSHLIFPQARLPLTRAVSVLHPRDHRPVFIFPWEGITLVGTTDMDHPDDLNAEPHISAGEFEYLLQAVQALFPCLELTSANVQGTFAGVRPVIDSGKLDPSKESREYVLWEDNGLITVSGGKLTTFRLMARSALKRAIRLLGNHTPRPLDEHILDRLPSGELLSQDFSNAGLPANTRLRILGRYGCEAHALLDAAGPDLLTPVGNTPSLWAELFWAASAEGVVHLSDLLMRRTRLGLTLPQGGLPLIDQIRSLTAAELGWTDAYWQAEIIAYSNLWHAHYNASQSCIDRTSVQDELVRLESLQEHTTP
jgi:glycerol-3-phosphate dehydrogenase